MDTFSLFPEREIDVDLEESSGWLKNKFKNFSKSIGKKGGAPVILNQVQGGESIGYTITFNDREDVVTTYSVRHDPYRDCWNCKAIPKNDVRGFEEMRKLIELDYKERNKLC